MAKNQSERALGRIEDRYRKAKRQADQLNVLAPFLSLGSVTKQTEPAVRTISRWLATDLAHERPDWAQLPIHAAQQAYCDNNEIFRGFCGGRGVGKTWIGAYDLLRRAKAGRHYLVIGPTYQLLRDSSAVTYRQLAEQLGCLRHSNQTAFFMEINTRDGGVAKINFRSADKPDTIARGPNYSGIHADEASLYPDNVVKLAIATLREAGQMGWLGMTFTPQGRAHWTYEWFYDADGKPKIRTYLSQARTKENPFLPPEFYDVLAGQYVAGSTLARQELDGEFVDVLGLLFNRAWFKWVEAVPRVAARVRYWDKAGTEGAGDYSAGVLMARGSDGLYWIEDVVRGQWSPHQRNAVILQTAQADAQRYGNEVTIWVEQEPGSGGKESAMLTVGELAAFPVYIDIVSGKGDKVVRSRPLCAQAEAGNVRVLGKDWTRPFLDELCLVGTTEISTIGGSVPISRVVPGDLVRTRAGWRRVLKSWQTSPGAQVCEVTLSDGRTLTGTPGHPVWVESKGFTRIEHLTAGDVLLPCTRAGSSTAIRTLKTKTIVGISDVGWAASCRSCIGICGSVSGGQSRPATSCITSMAIRPITELRTWSARRRLSTTRLTTPVAICGCESQSSARSVERHTRQGLTDSAIPARASAATGEPRSSEPSSGTRSPVQSVEKRRSRSSVGRYSAAISAGAWPVVSRWCHGLASFAASRSLQATGTARTLAPVHAPAVVSLRTLPGVQPVYNLEVEDCHEFFAQGVLVHNCAFPEGRWDDQLDSAAGAYNKLALGAMGDAGVTGDLVTNAPDRDAPPPKHPAIRQIEAGRVAPPDQPKLEELSPEERAFQEWLADLAGVPPDVPGKIKHRWAKYIEQD